jgi:hypothetical protein
MKEKVVKLNSCAFALRVVQLAKYLQGEKQEFGLFILEKLAAGETIEQILAAHPRLTREAIQAALAFAARALRADIIYPIQQTGT